MNRFKTFTLLVGGLLLAFTTSCTKETDQQDGEFSPGKKIHKITFDGVCFYGSGISWEDWHWNGNELSSIEHYYYHDSYNIGKENLEFKYNGRRVSRIDCFDEDRPNVLSNQSVFEYEEDRIKLITRDIRSLNYTDTIFHNAKWDFTYRDENLSQVVLTVTIDYLNNTLNVHHNTVYNLTWDGDNLTQVEVRDSSTRSEVLLFEYDTKNNPCYGHYDLWVKQCICGGITLGTDYGTHLIFDRGFIGPTISKNNCTKITWKINKQGQEVYNEVCNIGYLYDEDGYPTKATITHNSNSYNLYYEYE
jgi:hypothetical protein